MIRDFYIFKNTDQKYIYHQAFTRKPIDETLVTGFISAMSALIISIPEKTIKHVPVGSFKFTYTHFSGYIFILCSESEDIEEELETKLFSTLEYIEQNMFPILNDPDKLNEKMEEINSALDKMFLHEIKIALIGFGGVGKTTLFSLIQGKEIPLDYLPTTFVQYKRLEGKISETDIIIWDFIGQERFTPLWPMLIRGTQIILLVTDSTVENVLQTKRVFIKLIRKACPEALCIAIANKQDLPKAMSVPLVKKLLGFEEIYGVCAIDPSERRKIQNIIGHSIELYLAKQGKKI